MQETSKKEQPPWHPPFEDGKTPGLMVYNSLTQTKVPFIPSESNLVKWYICGPTTYDSAHFGHARNYVTFDIIRRILEDYFNYNIYIVMNITDVDDKIILGARKRYLLGQYLQEYSTVTETVRNDILEAYTDFEAKMDTKIKGLEAELQGKLSKEKKIEKTAELALNRGKLVPLEGLRKRLEEGSFASLSEVLEIDPTTESLSTLLDKRLGSEITDHAIFREHAFIYEQEFFEDLKALSVRMPDAITRVTEYIPEVIEFVTKIIENGFAYELEGSVYFDTQKFAASEHFYAKLEPWSVGDEKKHAEGEGSLSTIASTRLSDNDFALWKTSKPGEPRWNSPWGEGRPGWHIECSAMAGALFGSNMDIHCGGSDLRFPHHDNELAQAEAYFGCNQWVNYFLHSGHLNIDGLKMSKSLKNFVTIKEMLETVSARQVRLYFISQLWHRVMDFDRETGLQEIKRKEQILVRFFEKVSALGLDFHSLNQDLPQKWQALEFSLNTEFLETQKRVHAHLLDNFNTMKASLCLYDIVSAVNTYMSERGSSVRFTLVNKIASYVAKIFGVFGIDFPEYSLASSPSSEILQDKILTIKPYVDQFAIFRKRVRELAKGKADYKEFLALTDSIRDEVMPELGVRMEDDTMSLWTSAPKEVLLQEIEDKKRDASKALLKKYEAKLKLIKAQVEKWQQKSISPEQYYKENGYTLDAEGKLWKADKQISKSQLKNLQKKVVKPYEEYKKQVATKGPGFIKQLQAEATELENLINSMQTAN